jgi:hypothetical protein
LLALGAYLGQAERRMLVYKLWAFVLIAIGVGALWGLSTVGGIGGSSGHSMRWGLLMLPYLIGWNMGMWGPGAPRWLMWLGIGVGLWYLALAGRIFDERCLEAWELVVVIGTIGIVVMAGCIHRLLRNAPWLHRVIAAVHILGAIALGILVVLLWNEGDYAETFPWVLLAVLLLAIAWGLWKRRNWARVLALIIHWPSLVGAIVLLTACLLLLYGPPGESPVRHGVAFFGLVLLSPVLLASAWTLWYLQWRKVNNVAALDEQLKMLGERGGVLKVRVEFISYVTHDAIRGELEKAGFQEIDERTLLEKVFSSGSVKRVTGTINPARIEELAALSFVKSVKDTGSMDGPSGQDA